MAGAIVASPAHTHNSTKDEKEHPRKPDKRNKQVKGRNMRTTQKNARRTLSIQLRVRLEKNEAWRLKNLHIGRMETARTTCTADRGIDSIKRGDRREEDPVMRNRHNKSRPWNGKGVQKLEKDNLRSNRNNPGKLFNPFSCKNLSIHMTNRQNKPRPRNGKGVQKLEKDSLKSNRTNPGKPSNSFSCKNLSIHMNNLPSVNNKHINQKIQNRSSHYWNS